MLKHNENCYYSRCKKVEGGYIGMLEVHVQGKKCYDIQCKVVRICKQDAYADAIEEAKYLVSINSTGGIKNVF